MRDVDKYMEEKKKMVESCMVLGMLGIESFQDIKKHRIGVWLICAFGICGAICHMLHQKGEYQSLLGGMAIGLAMILVSVATQGKVGLGDGMVLFVTGIFLGFRKNLVLFTMSQALASVYALFLLVVRKKDRNHEFAYLPFLLISYVGMLAV